MRSTPEAPGDFYSDEKWHGRLGMCFATVLGFFLAATQPGGGEDQPLIERSAIGAAFAVALTYGGWILARVRARVGENTLVLQNYVTDIAIPYSIIQRITTNDGLQVELKDGRKVRGDVVARSRGGKWTGYQKAKRIRRAVQPFLAPADPAPMGVDVQRKVNLSLWVIPFTLLIHLLWHLLLRFVFEVS